MSETGTGGGGAEVQSAGAAKSRRGKETTLVDGVYQQLSQRITRGEFPPDGKLPGEHELAAMFGVSRPIVRGALGRLRDAGVIYSRQGSGSFVRSSAIVSTGLTYTPVETIADVQRFYEFRLTIEPDAAYYAAIRRDESSLAKIEEALGQLSDATRHRMHRSDADFLFHKAVADAANNHYYSSSMEALREHVAVGMHLHGLSLMGPKQQLEIVFREHGLIYEAISDERAQDARDAMHQHLKSSRDRLFEGRALDLSL
ncbi:FadR/GntR family transcriptional regulator [Devosia rhodophyticola]|uniref:Pyruvate dehydrogenase complex repressor n=1 Tax=Devosia rhodophyticola TaxID=3026423 RepID=A0ABY7Z100_9HYPH|nr:FadR/GntR family transcriptional regulator [Devosia rhodophyticola]WDR07157.1 FadR/GntR family transcriptional regulator [Devosia rhodophyticola]